MPAPELLAVGSALAFSISNLTVRKALKSVSSPFGAIVTFSFATLAMWLLVILGHYDTPSRQGLALFGLRGLLDPGISALFVFVAFRKIGISITIPIIAASSLISTTLSVILLNESLTLAIILGTLMIMGGVALLTVKKNKVENIKYAGFAILGSTAIGLANVVTKFALNDSNTPVAGVAVAFSAGLAFQLLAMAALKKWKEIPLKFETAKLFALAGLVVAVAFVLMIMATALGKVSIIVPLLSTQPLFALILSFLFLRAQEKITRGVILGTAAIVTGAALLSLA